MDFFSFIKEKKFQFFVWGVPQTPSSLVKNKKLNSSGFKGTKTLYRVRKGSMPLLPFTESHTELCSLDLILNVYIDSYVSYFGVFQEEHRPP